jgi:hypothetical protein
MKKKINDFSLKMSFSLGVGMAVTCLLGLASCLVYSITR